MSERADRSSTRPLALVGTASVDRPFQQGGVRLSTSPESAPTTTASSRSTVNVARSFMRSGSPTRAASNLRSGIASRKRVGVRARLDEHQSAPAVAVARRSPPAPVADDDRDLAVVHLGVDVHRSLTRTVRMLDRVRARLRAREDHVVGVLLGHLVPGEPSAEVAPDGAEPLRVGRDRERELVPNGLQPGDEIATSSEASDGTRRSRRAPHISSRSPSPGSVATARRRSSPTCTSTSLRSTSPSVKSTTSPRAAGARSTPRTAGSS